MDIRATILRLRRSDGLGGVDARDSLLEDLWAFNGGRASEVKVREGLGFAGGLPVPDDVGASSK